MIVVHHLNNSRSHRVLWLLEELGLEYEIKLYQRDPKTLLAPQSLRDVHPLGKSPVVGDGDRLLAESGAILEYLVDEHGGGRLRPEPGTDAFYQYRYWMHYAEGSAIAPFLLSKVFNETARQGPALARPLLKQISKAVHQGYINGQIRAHKQYWESSLADSEWFAGDDFTAADIQMSYVVEAGTARGASKYPNVAAYVERIRERPAYKAAVERGGPYSAAG